MAFFFFSFLFAFMGYRLKPRKTTSQKRQREPRFAFMTKSEVDHLEDGYNVAPICHTLTIAKYFI